MRYHGGKSRSGKKISLILKDLINSNPNITSYCEPFCGGCGVLSHMTSIPNIAFFGGDANESVISMWKSLVEGWVPDISTVTRERYIELKGNGEVSAEKGFVGHVVSYGGLYFKTFTESLIPRLPSAQKSVINTSRMLSNVNFQPGDYTQFSYLKNSVIFCDPPYEKNNRYFDEHNRLRKFDSVRFWKWCDQMSLNNIIVVNEMSNIIDKSKWTKISLPSRLVRYKNVLKEIEESIFILKTKKSPDIK